MRPSAAMDEHDHGSLAVRESTECGHEARLVPRLVDRRSVHRKADPTSPRPARADPVEVTRRVVHLLHDGPVLPGPR